VGQSKATLRGTITSDQGKTSKSLVTIKGLKQSALSDNAGQFVIQDLESITYQILVSRRLSSLEKLL
jgi:hypothetical protein